MSGAVTAAPDWLAALRARSGARLALGTAGAGMPTAAHLRFGLDHARARDAVHTPLDAAGLTAALSGLGHEILALRSEARGRAEYLLRPDLGRRVREADLEALRARAAVPPDLVVMIADGLSAGAVNASAAALVAALPAHLAADWRLAVVLGHECRVASGDAVAMAMGARAVLMLIGERPGLSSARSLGAYLTWQPRPDTSDAERNCLSNIRPGGLSVPEAAARLGALIAAAAEQGLTGVRLNGRLDRPSPATPRISGGTPQ